MARLWRQGQQSETVVVQHIITKGTIDEPIMKALSEMDTKKAALIDAVKADLKLYAEMPSPVKNANLSQAMKINDNL